MHADPLMWKNTESLNVVYNPFGCLNLIVAYLFHGTFDFKIHQNHMRNPLSDIVPWFNF